MTNDAHTTDREEHIDHDAPASQRRFGSVQIGAVAVLAAAFAGFFIGTAKPPAGPAPEALAWTRTEGADDPAAAEVAPAPSYAEIPQRARQRRRYTVLDQRAASASNTTQEIDAAPGASMQSQPRSSHQSDPVQRRLALAKRAERRAYLGAPPVVPHPVDPRRGDASCVACHKNGLDLGSVHAPPMSHRYMAACTQCHVEGYGANGAQPRALDNGFTGLPEPTHGPRAWPGAPPLIPHPTHMRQNCMSCHGPLGHAPLRTPHPERRLCTQCHLPSAVLDQRSDR